ncbi:MAG: cupin domain-containing protein [Pseudomonadota bacterium]
MTDRALDIKGAPGALMLRTESIPWTDFPSGQTEFKLLHVNLQTGGSTYLVRNKPGANLPIHQHLGGVEVYTIQGEWSYQEGEVGPGDYSYEPHCVVHKPAGKSDGFLLFVIQHGSTVFFAPDGTPDYILDCHRLYTRAKANNAVGHLKHLAHLMMER